MMTSIKSAGTQHWSGKHNALEDFLEMWSNTCLKPYILGVRAQKRQREIPLFFLSPAGIELAKELFTPGLDDSFYEVLCPGIGDIINEDAPEILGFADQLPREFEASHVEFHYRERVEALLKQRCATRWGHSDYAGLAMACLKIRLLLAAPSRLEEAIPFYEARLKDESLGVGADADPKKREAIRRLTVRSVEGALERARAELSVVKCVDERHAIQFSGGLQVLKSELASCRVHGLFGFLTRGPIASGLLDAFVMLRYSDLKVFRDGAVWVTEPHAHPIPGPWIVICNEVTPPAEGPPEWYRDLPRDMKLNFEWRLGTKL